ncbi:MAG: hypothetical protein KF708_14475 [Pirellulales bacterium]|nr:hypothetical protein [Pirellulales bacterium]
MPVQTSPKQVSYIATIQHVREVTLVGTSDLEYWSKHLRSRRLFPWINAGQAELLVSVPRLRWLGLEFCELSIAVRVSLSPDGATDDGVYLAYAFNSRRLLAAMERTWFSTPYHHAQIELCETPPQHFSLHDGDHTVIEARMGSSERESVSREESWEGTLYLPPASRAANGAQKQFHARIAGQTTILPFVAGADSFVAHPSFRHAGLDCLVDGGFTPREWHIRSDAVHARSKTFRRDA